MAALQTVLTAFAVIGAWLSALLAWRAGDRATAQRETQGRREEWWRRFQWATELALDSGPQRAEVGTVVLKSVSRSELAGRDELAAILEVLAAIYQQPLADEVDRGNTGFEQGWEEADGEGSGH